MPKGVSSDGVELVALLGIMLTTMSLAGGRVVELLEQ